MLQSAYIVRHLFDILDRRLGGRGSFKEKEIRKTGLCSLYSTRQYRLAADKRGYEQMRVWQGSSHSRECTGERSASDNVFAKSQSISSAGGNGWGTNAQ